MLGLVSMFMDVSSELIHSLLPVYMASVLGASMAMIGLVEGVAEGTAAITKVFSGLLSDYIGRRKTLAVAGYALGAMSKPLFPLATSIGWVFGARFIDRIGKGIRGAPRDALVADITPEQYRGAAYGLRQSLDSVGAFIGPLLAIVFMILLNQDIRHVLWLAVAPAFLAVLLLILGVREPRHAGVTTGTGKRVTMSDARQLTGPFWFVIIIGAVFTLSRFSEAFLILRALDSGLSARYVPVVMVIMNIAYSLFAYPAGAAADRHSPRMLLVFGLLLLIIADIILAVANSPSVVFLGAGCWGLHMALTQGLLSKLVADTVPGRLRGTAFGIFNLVSGAALLLASIIAGILWNVFGAPATFAAGAVFAALTMTGLLFFHPHRQSVDQPASR